jgi:hypothetical protein
MEKVYQVFVSSTYSDLKDERKRVSDTLAKAGFIAAGMELFPAADQQQFDFIKRVIDRSDYYVVIVGGRYGSVADEKISYTEMEYEYARERKIPILAFLHKTPDMIPVGKTDQNEDKATRLKRFRDALAKGRLVDFWDDAGDLCTRVTIAVVNASNLAPGVGWVRGDQAIDPKVLQELERLRIENEALKAQLIASQGEEISFPVHLSGPEDAITIDFVLRRKNQQTTETFQAQVTPRYVFESVVDLIIREISERVLCDTLAKIYASQHLEIKDIGSIGIAPEDVKKLRFHLEALGLIKAESRQGTSSKYISWTMTEKGRRFIASLRGIPK